MAEENQKEKPEEEKSEKAEETKEDSKEEKQKEEKAEEKKVEEPKEDSQPQEKKESAKVSDTKDQDKKPAPTGKYKDIVKKIEELSVLELSELVRELEERFGVSAAAPVAAQAPEAPADQTATGGGETKRTLNIELTSGGEKKINVIKAIREINPDLGLKEAKDLVDSAPKIIKEGVKKEEAEEIKKKIEAAGGQVSLK